MHKTPDEIMRETEQELRALADEATELAARNHVPRMQVLDVLLLRRAQERGGDSKPHVEVAYHYGKCSLLCSLIADHHADWSALRERYPDGTTVEHFLDMHAEVLFNLLVRAQLYGEHFRVNWPTIRGQMRGRDDPGKEEIPEQWAAEREVAMDAAKAVAEDENRRNLLLDSGLGYELDYLIDLYAELKDLDAGLVEETVN